MHSTGVMKPKLRDHSSWPVAMSMMVMLLRTFVAITPLPTANTYELWLSWLCHRLI